MAQLYGSRHPLMALLAQRRFPSTYGKSRDATTQGAAVIPGHDPDCAIRVNLALAHRRTSDHQHAARRERRYARGMTASRRREAGQAPARRIPGPGTGPALVWPPEPMLAKTVDHLPAGRESGVPMLFDVKFDGFLH